MFSLNVYPLCRQRQWIQSFSISSSSCVKQKLPLGNECACMDKHVHAKHNVNTAFVYDTHRHTSQCPNKALGLRLYKNPLPPLLLCKPVTHDHSTPAESWGRQKLREGEREQKRPQDLEIGVSLCCYIWQAACINC